VQYFGSGGTSSPNLRLNFLVEHRTGLHAIELRSLSAQLRSVSSFALHRTLSVGYARFIWDDLALQRSSALHDRSLRHCDHAQPHFASPLPSFSLRCLSRFNSNTYTIKLISRCEHSLYHSEVQAIPITHTLCATSVYIPPSIKQHLDSHRYPK
jgi:hypothetical protein